MGPNQVSLGAALIFLSLLIHVVAHVALTYPPARKYDLDFLDNSRTKAPCGMPSGSIKTSFLSGSRFNVTWHLGYPHKGGFKIQLLDELERPVLDLTPYIQGSEFITDDATAQSFPVQLPQNYSCLNCTLRLVRQALEWGTNYRFWSCADVDIQTRKEFRETCSGNGRYLVNRCKCNHLYYGNRCQYKNECWNDNDCGVQGKCLDIEATTAPYKQCYCQLGWFGRDCSKKSPIKSTEIDFTLYREKKLSNTFKLYWRVLKEQNEIEMIMVTNGTSYAAIGWRPHTLTSVCKNFPLIGLTSNNIEKLKQNNDGKPTDGSRSEAEPESDLGQNIFKQEPETNIEIKKPAFSRRSASQVYDMFSDEITETSVSYQVSSKQGRKKRFDKETMAVPSSEPNPNQGQDKNKQTLVITSKPEILKSNTVSISQTKANLDDELRTEIHPTSEPESTVEPEPTSEPIHNGERNIHAPSPEPEDNSEPESSSISEHNSQTESTSEPEPSTEPNHSSKLTPNFKQKYVPTIDVNSITASTSEPTNYLEPKSIPESDTKLETTKSEATLQLTPTKNKGDQIMNLYTPRHDFNPMDCTDIVIGSARNTVSRIADYYTRDRSTPRMDSFWGGRDDLTAATGFEKDGVTTILFRKKIISEEQSDHSVVDDLMHVIWAQGQELGKYIHVPKSGIETTNAKIKNFYKPDELKYHGHGSQRGVSSINFLDEPNKSNTTEMKTEANISNCSGEWKLPKNCNTKNGTCEYSVTWKYLPRNDEILFTLITKHTKTWTGIAFSHNEKMSQTDAILGWVDQKTGRAFMMDTWISGYTKPLLDASQNIDNINGHTEDGITMLSFTRKRNSNDEKDLSFADDQCLFMIFPIKGGDFDGVNKKMQKHISTPIVSTNKICINSCGNDMEVVFDTTIMPEWSNIDYNIRVKIIDLGENFQFPEPQTLEFQELSNNINDNFKTLFNIIPGYKKNIIEDLQQENNDIIAIMNLQLDKTSVEKSLSPINNIHDKEVYKTIQDGLLGGTVGALKVDRNFLFFEPKSVSSNITDESSEENGSFFNISGTKLYLVLGCIAALILIAILQASCTIYKTSRKSSSSHKDHLIPNSSWKDYSASNTNYAFDTFEEEKKQITSKGKSETLPQKNMRVHKPQRNLPSVINQQSGYIGDTRSLQRSRGPLPSGNLERSTFSLPRTAYDRHTHTQDMHPDFYFMPSQRKYSENQKPNISQDVSASVIPMNIDVNKEESLNSF